MSELVISGLELMMIGMGTVFAFLTLLVFTTSSMSAVINRFAPEAPAEKALAPAAASNTVNPTLLAAIQEAVNQHRARQK